MESADCPADQSVSPAACSGASVVEADRPVSHAASEAPSHESEDLDSFNLIEPPPLDWRSDSSSEAGSADQMEDPSISPSSVPVEVPEDGLGESAPPLDTSDAAISPLPDQEELVDEVLEDLAEQISDPGGEGESEDVGELGEEEDVDEQVQEDVDEQVNGEEGDFVEEAEERRLDDEDHIRIHALLNQLQLAGDCLPFEDTTPHPSPPCAITSDSTPQPPSPPRGVASDSTPHPPSPPRAVASGFEPADASLVTDVNVLLAAPLQTQASALTAPTQTQASALTAPTQTQASVLTAPTQTQASGLLFSESHQRDLLGLLECTEIGSPQRERESPQRERGFPQRENGSQGERGSPQRERGSPQRERGSPHTERGSPQRGRGSPQSVQAQAACRPPSGEVDAVVSVSYNQEDGERFWDHLGHGQFRHRGVSMGSLPEDEIPEPVWMKLGEEPPEEVASAGNNDQSTEDRPSYKDVPGPCDPEDLLDGVIFGANYLGSTQLKSDKNPSTNARMVQAQEAVDRIKAPEGESQPMTDVDLFISTQRIKVLSADTQEAMMDHSLQMISYIADIGNIVVLMARRRPAGRKSQEDGSASSSSGPQKKCCMICHVFTSDDAQVIAQAIGQAFGVAYQQFLQANGIKASELNPSQYSDYLGTQELYNGDLVHFSDSDNIREVTLCKAPGEGMGVAVVESGWGSILPTVVVANLLHGGPAERSGALSIGDRIMSVNGTSLVGLPIASCHSIIRDLKNQTSVKLSIVHCPPVTMAIIKRPDPKFQLGFSVEDGIICSLMRGGIAERGGIRVGHRIIEINGQSVVATPHEKIIHILTTAIGEIHLKTMPASTYRLLTGQEQPIFL